MSEAGCLHPQRPPPLAQGGPAPGPTGERHNIAIRGLPRHSEPGSPGEGAGAVRRAGEQGAAAVEFALALPLFLVLWFGVIDFGLAMYAKGLITNASQEGARFGAIYRLNPLPEAEIQAHVRSYLQAAGFTDPVTVTVSGAGGASGSTLSIRVDYAYQFIALPAFVTGLTGNLNLSAETVTRLE